MFKNTRMPAKSPNRVSACRFFVMTRISFQKNGAKVETDLQNE